MKQILLSAFGLLSFYLCFSQSTAIGEWKDHLSYYEGTAMVSSGNKIYAASKYGLFYYDTDDKTINRISKINKLSDIGITALADAPEVSAIVIGYGNGNVDLLVDGKVYNIPDIRRSLIVGDKTINNILVQGRLAYLSCGFGIVVLDLSKKEVKDTYKIGNNAALINVRKVLFYQNKIIATTKEGIYWAYSSGTNLSAFQNWKRYTELPKGVFSAITEFNGLIYAAYDTDAAAENPAVLNDSIFVFNNTSWSQEVFAGNYRNEDVTILNSSSTELFLGVGSVVRILNTDKKMTKELTTYSPSNNFPQRWNGYALTPAEMITKNGDYWINDKVFGLNKIIADGKSEYFFPSGPSAVDVWEMKCKNDRLWVATGGYDNAINLQYKNIGFYAFDGVTWSNYFNTMEGWKNVRDLLSVAPHPSDKTKAYFASYNTGVVEFTLDKISTIYNATNSSLQDVLPGFTFVSGVDFDNNGNLWAINSGLLGASISKPLHVLSNGKWIGFTIPAVTNNSTILMKLMVDSKGNKWSIKVKGNNGVVVMKEKSNDLSVSTAFNVRHFSVGEGNGRLPSEKVNDIVEDKKGQIWFATDQGIAVIYDLTNLYAAGSFDVQQIKITQEGVTHNLLETNRVTCIAVDGGNKKWIGTDGSGVFQMSEDGTVELKHFTAENSPLFSNVILDIAINDNTGEVYFATEKGIISYRSTATEGKEINENVYAFPNPVKTDFQGIIGINGLVNNAIVKITDLSGNIVYETHAEGGMATWDGKRNGERVQSGVYLVFISNSDGTQKEVTKIAFIN